MLLTVTAYSCKEQIKLYLLRRWFSRRETPNFNDSWSTDCFTCFPTPVIKKRHLVGVEIMAMRLRHWIWNKENLCVQVRPWLLAGVVLSSSEFQSSAIGLNMVCLLPLKLFMVHVRYLIYLFQSFFQPHQTLSYKYCRGVMAVNYVSFFVATVSIETAFWYWIASKHSKN